MDEIVCDDCGDVVEKEDDLNEVWSKFSEKNVKICSEYLKMPTCLRFLNSTPENNNIKIL